MIYIESVSKRIKGRRIFEGITLRVEPGQIAGVTGPNGSGKSLLLELAAGITRPDSGAVRVFGIDPFKRWNESLKIIGYLAQDDLSRRMRRTKAIEYLRYLGSIHGLRGKKLRDRIEAMEKLFELEEMTDCPIERLSAGERIRLRLACEIVHDPKAVILDEPLIPLDARWRKIVTDLLKELKNMGKAILIASAYGEELKAICDVHISLVPNNS
ncbi:TPA: ABC transporter ATP-binding protein [Candidatus Poribacteria bacterium]|nr:ABC transporter ATP-binding protein [Candidatus Poribacteria bacterium]HEX29059.1 ABC transporter ATP-binding protein [Candidatus Poribacteria bacterium]